jgi:two-component system, OmpR family, heavy metal sensor histidine kinase CusS
MYLKIVRIFKKSLTVRLAILFSTLSAFLLIFLSAGLFFNTAWQLKQEDMASIKEFSALIKKDLLKGSNIEDNFKKSVYQELSVFHYHHYEVSLFGNKNQIIYRSEQFPLDLQKKMLAIRPTSDFKYSWINQPLVSLNQHYLATMFEVKLKPPELSTIKVIVVLNTTHHIVFLTKLKQMLIWFVSLGFCMFTALGIVLTRRELRPIWQFSNTIKQFSMQNLTQRIFDSNWPDELIPLAKTFDALIAHVESGVRSLNHFSSDLAHELRTPITNLRIETEVLLEQQRTSQEYELCLRNNLEELERLSAMIERLLILARLDNLAFSLCLSSVDLNILIQKLITYYDIIASEKNITLCQSGHAIIIGDATLIEMAIGNIISNAIKYSNGYTKIEIDLIQVPSQSVEVCIKDQGIGLDVDQQLYVFDRFYRVDSSRSQQIQGNGLGLALVKAIMDVHQGQVFVDSKLNVGSLFVLQFPLKPILSDIRFK